MPRFGNVATPPEVVTVAAPDNVPAPGLVPIAMVTAFVAVGTKFPWASCMLTCTAGVIATAETTFVGCTVNASFAGGPAVTLKGVLVAPVSVAALAASV